MHLRRIVVGILVVAFGAGCGPDGSAPSPEPAKIQSKEVAGPVLTDVLPDFVPWNREELRTFALTTANGSDRLVSCDDWTQVDPTPITGQRIISFQLGSANLGLGHLRIRRGAQMPDGWHMYQTTSQIDQDGQCSAIETEIAVVPSGQSGRWLPLASFSLYSVTEDGGIGDLVVCQMKRWCCLSSTPTCSGITAQAPCALGFQTDNINAGTRDVYPFHWLDQFVPIQDVPSGQYWFLHWINPAGVLIESDSTNNGLWLLIEIDQEAGTARIVDMPEDSQCPML